MSMLQSHRRSRGLTLFEFAIAVSVIGVLIAVALPRLAAPLVSARQVRLKMLLAATQTTAGLFNIRCAALGTADPSCPLLKLDELEVAGVNGWPAARIDGIATALNLSGDTSDIDWQPERIEGVPALRARLKPIGVVGACEFIYAQAAAPGAVPRIELIDASCS